MESISNVKAFPCETLDAAGQRALQNAHKRLPFEAANPNMRILTAVGNNGVVYALERTLQCDEIALHDLEQRLQKAIEKTKTRTEVYQALNIFFREVKQHGIHHYSAEN